VDNHLTLYAHLAEAQPLRYTPAGLPALDMWLEHASRQSDSGQEREVKLRLKAIAFGALAERIGRQNLGSPWRFSGFLATGRGGKSVVFHIQDMQTL